MAERNGSSDTHDRPVGELLKQLSFLAGFIASRLTGRR
jgi:hypothetical protein